MSQQLSGQDARQVSIQNVLGQLAALEDYISRLQAALNELETRIAVLDAAEKALYTIENNAEILTPLDGVGDVYARAKILESGKVIYHVGLDIYIELPRDKVVELIREERASIARIADMYRRELAQASQYYASLRAVVEQAVSRAQQRQG
ncbi:MAG TPA: prefoldin subunit alpha [Pyrodictium sp.]|nr:prefoldin subunit alpha [Pyrodictium sp.]